MNIYSSRHSFNCKDIEISLISPHILIRFHWMVLSLRILCVVNPFSSLTVPRRSACSGIFSQQQTCSFYMFHNCIQDQHACRVLSSYMNIYVHKHWILILNFHRYSHQINLGRYFLLYKSESTISSFDK